jgi:putative hemolysin
MSYSKVHLGFVSHQGQVRGIITVEDILEELVGEIFDETDAEEAAAAERGEAQ